jgi:hypothetical protein
MNLPGVSYHTSTAFGEAVQVRGKCDSVWAGRTNSAIVGV